MPTYIVGNVRTQRVQTVERLLMFFSHVEALGLEVTDITYAKTGGIGQISVTTTQTIPADQRIHLGLT